MEIEDKNFFSIGEIEKKTGVKQHTLRYWETAFRILRPARRTTGQRRYTKEDIAHIAKIKSLLYDKGYTILGAKKALIEEKRKLQKQPELEFGKETSAQNMLKKTKKELDAILNILR